MSSPMLSLSFAEIKTNELYTRGRTGSSPGAQRLCTIGPTFVVMQLHLSFGVAVLGAVLVPVGVWLLTKTTPARGIVRI